MDKKNKYMAIRKITPKKRWGKNWQNDMIKMTAMPVML